MTQQFEYCKKDSDDLAAKIASLEELAESHFASFAYLGSDSIDVDRNRCIVIANAGSRFDDLLLNDP